MTLLCDCGLMGKFSWVWDFFLLEVLKLFISEASLRFFCGWAKTWQTFGKQGNCFANFAWNTNILQETRAVKRAKLQRFSTVECNLIGFCFGLLTLYWFKEKLLHRSQSLSNHSHHALFSTNPEQNQSQRWIGLRPWHGLHVFASKSDWFIRLICVCCDWLFGLHWLNAESARVCMVNISFSRRTNEERICCGRNFANIFAQRKQLRRPEQTLCQD